MNYRLFTCPYCGAVGYHRELLTGAVRQCEECRNFFSIASRPRNNRYYLRGTSLLGIVNTVIACIFNRVLVRCTDSDTGETVRWFFDRATNHPRKEEP